MSYKIFMSICLLGWAIASVGCRKKHVREIPFTTYVDIPAGLNVMLTHHFPIPNVFGMPNETMIIAARPSYIRLTAIQGQFNLDFIQHAYLDVVRDSSRAEMGYLLNAPLQHASYIDLFPSIVEMRDDIVATDFDLELKLVLRDITTDITRLRVDFNMQVTDDE